MNTEQRMVPSEVFSEVFPKVSAESTHKKVFVCFLCIL